MIYSVINADVKDWPVPSLVFHKLTKTVLFWTTIQVNGQPENILINLMGQQQSKPVPHSECEVFVGVVNLSNTPISPAAPPPWNPPAGTHSWNSNPQPVPAPKRMPMDSEAIFKATPSAYGLSDLAEVFQAGIRAAESFHGITP